MTCQYIATCGDDIKLWDYNSLTVQKQLNVCSTSRTVANISWSQDDILIYSLFYV